EKYLSNKKIELANIKERKDSLVGDGKKRAGSINEKFEDLLKFETRISNITQHLKGDDLTMNYLKIQGEIKRLGQEIQNKRGLSNRLSQLIISIQKLKDELKDITSEYKELIIKSERSKSELNRLNEEKTKLELGINNEKKSIQKILIRYGYDNVDVKSDILKELQRREIGYADKEQKFKDREKEQSELINKLKIINNNIIPIKERQDALVEEGKVERNIINTLSASRILKLAEGLFPNQEREKSRIQLTEKENQLEILQKNVEEQVQEIKEEKGVLSEKENQLKTAGIKIEKIESDLEIFIQEKEMLDIETLEKMMLELNEFNSLEEKARELKEQEIKLEQQEKTFTEQLADLSKTIDDDTPDRETLEAELEELSRNFEEKKEQKIQQEFQLAENKKRIKNSETLIQKIDTQRQECKRWEILKDLIGSADGKKFSKFAQGLTLKRLTDLANKHLEHLNHRYIIQKSSELDLELEIIDTYHADSIRSLSTLSGGESFLISLALALGLSDLAGRNANIGSLFIDEGFGTLSDEPLEMAINTLERLQNKGKTIGVISHVQQLKERIGVQIQLEKMGNGFSRMKVVN
ncbi:MAG: SbcC/MukB-like Walker B domain-containing protein, partial [Saprospiraceae bacterium]